MDIEKHIQDIEKQLPESSRVDIQLRPLSSDKYMAKVKLKGLGKSIAVSEVADDKEYALRTAKKKAIAKVQSMMRKQRGRWRRSYYYEKYLSPAAS